MGTTTISQLTSAAPLSGSEVLEIEQAGVARKVNINTLIQTGTCSLSAADASSGGNITDVVTGYWTKIGRQVTVIFTFINVDTTGMTGGNIFYIQGLPFTNNTGETAVAAFRARRISFTDGIIAEVINGANYVRLNNLVQGADGNAVLVSSLEDDGADIIGCTLTYFTDE